MKKLTEQERQDLKEFQDHVDYWITALGLTDWDNRTKLNNDNDNANTLLNLDGRKAYIGLCRKRDRCISIKQLAIHEVLEVCLGDIHFALCKFYSKEYSENLTHSLINRLIPILSEFGK